MTNVAILGASGYTGLELLRILVGHGGVEVAGVASRSHPGKAVTALFPSLKGFYDDSLVFKTPEELLGVGADVFFSALPHGASASFVSDLAGAGKTVIDLSADFRIRDIATYEKWYGAHGAPHLLKDAVYGIPELYREQIGKARLVANPGCYPTSAILALAPLLKEGLIEPGSVIIDSKSGVSGAGRSATLDTSYCEASGGFKAYKIGAHRHTPEIEQELGRLFGGAQSVTFTPHLLPVSRGILTTAYASLRSAVETAALVSLYGDFYRGERFVRVLEEGLFPDIKDVRGSNCCDIGLFSDASRGRVTVVSAIDNLVKGASGQAVQNMNVVLGMDEGEGLKTPPSHV